MSKKLFRSFLPVLLVVLSFAAVTAFAQIEAPKDFSNIKIKNFGEMDEHFYRGAQPGQNDYQSLAALGVKTIVDLQDEPTSYERTSAEAAGIKYVNIPMSDTKYPSQSSIDTFLNLIKDPATGTIYVHCAGGRHRTGVIGAVYRFNKYGWNYDQVYAEMKKYDFYTRWGHGAMKDFVVDYAEKIKTDPSYIAMAHPIAQPTK